MKMIHHLEISSLGVCRRLPQIVTWNGLNPLWRSGPQDKSIFIGIPGMDSSYFNGYNLRQNLQQRTTYFSAEYNNISLCAYGFTSPGGILTLMCWDDGSKSGFKDWVALNNGCQFNGTCILLASAAHLTLLYALA